MDLQHRVAALSRLDSAVDSVQVLIWHSLQFESVLRRVILQRLGQLGLQPSAVDAVTARFRWTDGAFVLDLEPIDLGGRRTS